MTADRGIENTDRELWREREGDYYADSIHVTEEGCIGINCGGMVHVMPLRKWHVLVTEIERLQQRLAEAEAERDAARYRYVRTLNPHEFDSLVRRNIRDDLAFDSLVDAALQERKP